MSKWRDEFSYVGRYLCSGGVNTTLGFMLIFILMWLGVMPVLANIVGYLFGFVLGFFVTKRLVFKSDGHFVVESFRYFVSFIASFLMNLLTLVVLLDAANINIVFAQIVSAGSYTALMYFLTRYYVFKVRN